MERGNILKAFMSHPGAANQLAVRTGIPRKWISEFIHGTRAGVRGKSKQWAAIVTREAIRLSKPRRTQ
jgi:hypothetical protein